MLQSIVESINKSKNVDKKSIEGAGFKAHKIKSGMGNVNMKLNNKYLNLLLLKTKGVVEARVE